MSKDVPQAYQFSEVFEGQETQFEVCITEALMAQFEALSGDHNPLHNDAVYAESTLFGERVVYGFLCGSFFSQLIGMHLPGRHAVYLSQDLRFHAPARIGMSITVKGTVVQKIEAVQALKIKTEVFDTHKKQLLINGFAMVKMLV